MLGLVTLRDMIDANVLDVVRERVGFEVLGDIHRPIMVCDFIQARRPDWVRAQFFAEFDDDAVWFDDLRPAFGKERFYFETDGDRRPRRGLPELTELLLD